MQNRINFFKFVCKKYHTRKNICVWKVIYHRQHLSPTVSSQVVAAFQSSSSDLYRQMAMRLESYILFYCTGTVIRDAPDTDFAGYPANRPDIQPGRC
jgi:hypothetical protein